MTEHALRAMAERILERRRAGDDALAHTLTALRHRFWTSRGQDAEAVARFECLAGKLPVEPEQQPGKTTAPAPPTGRSAEYRARMARPDWQAIRHRVLVRCGGVCEACHHEPASDVHHLHYRTLGREGLDDVVALCRRCHERDHELRRGSNARAG